MLAFGALWLQHHDLQHAAQGLGVPESWGTNVLGKQIPEDISDNLLVENKIFHILQLLWSDTS